MANPTTNLNVRRDEQTATKAKLPPPPPRKANGKAAAISAKSEATLDSKVAWERVAKTYWDNFESPALDGVKILLAAVAAHRITAHPPAWVLCIAPSGSMKTVALESLRGLPSIHFIDEVTPSTFISGKLNEPGARHTGPASLLHRIGRQGILIIADFSTYSAIDPKSQQRVLAQMRRIYDGNISREFGTADNPSEREWHGRLTILAGATPEIDRRTLIHQSLGERFIKTRWQRAGGVDTARRAFHQDEKVTTTLRRDTHRLLLPILQNNSSAAPAMPTRMETALGSLSELICLSRAYVPRERSTHKICDIPVPEGNTRLPQELAQIGRGWALLEGSQQVSAEGWRLIQLAAFHCLPPARQLVLEALIHQRSPYASELPHSVIERALEDLELLGVANKEQQTFTDLARRLWQASQFTQG